MCVSECNVKSDAQAQGVMRSDKCNMIGRINTWDVWSLSAIFSIHLC